MLSGVASPQEMVTVPETLPPMGTAKTALSVGVTIVSAIGASAAPAAMLANAIDPRVRPVVEQKRRASDEQILPKDFRTVISLLRTPRSRTRVVERQGHNVAPYTPLSPPSAS